MNELVNYILIELSLADIRVTCTCPAFDVDGPIMFDFESREIATRAVNLMGLPTSRINYEGGVKLYCNRDELMNVRETLKEKNAATVPFYRSKMERLELEQSVVVSLSQTTLKFAYWL